MKNLNYLSLAAIAALGLASCSSDEPGPNPGNENTRGEHYMAVTIRTAGMGGATRAAEPGNPEFEGAAGNEGTITPANTYFYFYDDAGNPFQLAAANVDGTVSTNVVKPTNIQTIYNDGQEPELQGILVLGKGVGEGYVGNTPTQMLCVANPKASNIDAYANQPLSYVLNQINRSDSDIPNLTNFVMTSSTYVDGGQVITAVNVADKFKTTPDDAKADPATIYLERLAAKVRAQGLGNYTPQFRNAQGEIVADYEYKVDNEAVELQVSLDAWRLTNIAQESRAFKSVAADGNYFTGWNAPDLHRCYWALSNVGRDALVNRTFDIYNAAAWTRGNFNAANPTQNIAYVYEHTLFTNAPTSATDRFSDATGIVVKATVKMRAKGSQDEFQPVDLVRWAGAYYTSAELKEMIINNYKASHPESTLTASAVSFVKDGDKPNRWKAQIHNAGTTIDWSENYNNLQWWQNGVTSYYLNVEHLGGLFGIVRNHIYDYTFTNVIGLGIPGNDPENPTPEQETFLAARLAILNWHVVSNRVVLE